LGYFLPNLWLRDKIKKRQNEIQLALPDVLDLLVVCVEAGLGFDSAMQKVTDKLDNELTREFAQVIREIRLGKPRREALRDMVERTQVADVSSFISAIIQADQLGVSIGRILTIQSEQMRIKRRQRAEKKAHEAPIKMLIPMALFMLPTIYLVILGPMAPKLLGGMLGIE
ncbi:MAG TPA: type II secretion system F family protein, partial [Dehalococcoidia bacterium]|nr:type II secretion system F family protein [Dehalococcoidia bacterium]